MSSRSALQNDAGTSQLDWHKSGTQRSPNVLAVTDWKNARWKWKDAVCCIPDITDGAKLLACRLVDHFAHHETAFCNPSVDTMAQALGKAVRSIQRALSDLQKAGWLKVDYAKGRGRTSKIIFLCGPNSAALNAPKKVTRLAALHADQPQNPLEGVTEASPLAPEGVTNMAGKGDSNGTPLLKPKENKKERAPEKKLNERPSCPVEAVPYGSDAENEWDAYLQAHNLPKLSELNRKFSDDRGCGWEMPRRRPPRADDAISNRVALSFARWCAFQKGFAI